MKIGMFLLESLLLAIVLVNSIHSAEENHQQEKEKPKWNSTTILQLKNDLQRYTNPNNLHDGVMVTVNLTVNIESINVDYTTSTVEMQVWFLMEWMNPNFQWDPNKYNGLDIIHFPTWEIWKPDFHVYNSANKADIGEFSRTSLLLYNTGIVKWKPYSKFVIYCNLDLTDWPFDVQQCLFQIGSFTYTNNLLDINPTLEQDEHLAHYVEYGWYIKQATRVKQLAFLEYCENPISQLQYLLHIEKTNHLYHSFIFIPALVLATLLLSTFLLPLKMTEKFSLVGLTTLVTCLFLIFFILKVPTLSQQAPKIVKYYTYLVCLCTLYFVVLVLLYNMYTSPRFKKTYMPKILELTLQSSMVALLVTIDEDAASRSIGSSATLLQNASNEITSNESTNQTRKTDLIFSQWQNLALLLDRLLFIVYFLIIIVLLFALVFSL